MGVHSGPVVAGVVGTKIPHYSVFGETVDMAGLMEAAGEPMKIQVIIIGNISYPTLHSSMVFISISEAYQLLIVESCRCNGARKRRGRYREKFRLCYS